MYLDIILKVDNVELVGHEGDFTEQGIDFIEQELEKLIAVVHAKYPMISHKPTMTLSIEYRREGFCADARAILIDHCDKHLIGEATDWYTQTTYLASRQLAIDAARTLWSPVPKNEQIKID